MGIDGVFFLVIGSFIMILTLVMVGYSLDMLFEFNVVVKWIMVTVLAAVWVTWIVMTVQVIKQENEVKEQMVHQVQELTGESGAEIYSSDGDGKYRVKSGKSIYDVQVEKGEVDMILQGNGVLYEKE